MGSCCEGSSEGGESGLPKSMENLDNKGFGVFMEEKIDPAKTGRFIEPCRLARNVLREKVSSLFLHVAPGFRARRFHFAPC